MGRSFAGAAGAADEATGIVSDRGAGAEADGAAAAGTSATGSPPPQATSERIAAKKAGIGARSGAVMVRR